jgi:hypothetical protein
MTKRPAIWQVEAGRMRLNQSHSACEPFNA